MAFWGSWLDTLMVCFRMYRFINLEFQTAWSCRMSAVEKTGLCWGLNIYYFAVHYIFVISAVWERLFPLFFNVNFLKRNERGEVIRTSKPKCLFVRETFIHKQTCKSVCCLLFISRLFSFQDCLNVPLFVLIQCGQNQVPLWCCFYINTTIFINTCIHLF